MERLNLMVPAALMDKIEKAVTAGDDATKSELVRNAIRQYLHRKKGLLQRLVSSI